jgi:hypothetical protein
MKKVLTVTMDGIRYHASRPADCRHCFFWKNRKKGCVLGKENCYYLIEPPKGPSKCEGERAGHVPKAGGVSAKQRIRWIPDTLRMDTEARSSRLKSSLTA